MPVCNGSALYSFAQPLKLPLATYILQIAMTSKSGSLQANCLQSTRVRQIQTISRSDSLPKSCGITVSIVILKYYRNCLQTLR